MRHRQQIGSQGLSLQAGNLAQKLYGEVNVIGRHPAQALPGKSCAQLRTNTAQCHLHRQWQFDCHKSAHLRWLRPLQPALRLRQRVLHAVPLRHKRQEQALEKRNRIARMRDVEKRAGGAFARQQLAHFAPQITGN